MVAKRGFFANHHASSLNGPCEVFSPALRKLHYSLKSEAPNCFHIFLINIRGDSGL